MPLGVLWRLMSGKCGPAPQDNLSRTRDWILAKASPWSCKSMAFLAAPFANTSASTSLALCCSLWKSFKTSSADLRKSSKEAPDKSRTCGSSNLLKASKRLCGGDASTVLKSNVLFLPGRAGARSARASQSISTAPPALRCFASCCAWLMTLEANSVINWVPAFGHNFATPEAIAMFGLTCWVVRTCVPLQSRPTESWYAARHWNALTFALSNISAMRCSVDARAITYVSFSNVCPAACHSKSSRVRHLCQSTGGMAIASCVPLAPACIPVKFTCFTTLFQEGSSLFAMRTLNTSTGSVASMQNSVCQTGRDARGTPFPPHDPSRLHICRTVPSGSADVECSLPRCGI
mmetsp:Transcript_52443/g.125305  ORF Transcript_52443/g.125305 Transcript_52443/m.125305 type:complete len:348 (+) Transcript_52443:431-1474(+)